MKLPRASASPSPQLGDEETLRQYYGLPKRGEHRRGVAMDLPKVCVRIRIFATLATMYPRLFFDTYWRSSLRKEVFVAMSFAHEFDGVWNDAIRPAIETDLADAGGSYRAHRVDISKISDSIHREILDGIAHATLVFADISVMRTGDWKGQRNGNVMFELGIAQTVRPATDLIVVSFPKSGLSSVGKETGDWERVFC